MSSHAFVSPYITKQYNKCAQIKWNQSWLFARLLCHDCQRPTGEPEIRPLVRCVRARSFAFVCHFATKQQQHIMHTAALQQHTVPVRGWQSDDDVVGGNCGLCVCMSQPHVFLRRSLRRYGPNGRKRNDETMGTAMGSRWFSAQHILICIQS